MKIQLIVAWAALAWVYSPFASANPFDGFEGDYLPVSRPVVSSAGLPSTQCVWANLPALDKMKLVQNGNIILVDFSHAGAGSGSSLELAQYHAYSGDHAQIESYGKFLGDGYQAEHDEGLNSPGISHAQKLKISPSVTGNFLLNYSDETLDKNKSVSGCYYQIELIRK